MQAVLASIAPPPARAVGVPRANLPSMTAPRATVEPADQPCEPFDRAPFVRGLLVISCVKAAALLAAGALHELGVIDLAQLLAP